MNSLEQSCSDILTKNMWYQDQSTYLLYDTESPLAKVLSDAWINVLSEIKNKENTIREFKNPPQPLYRGGLINPDNPHLKEQNRIVTSHNIEENKRVGLDHHEALKVELNEENIDPQVELLKNELISLPKWSIVILVQSTNFRLSTFRIRLELFHRGIHVVEFNHLAYIPEKEFSTFTSSLSYNTPEYVRLQDLVGSYVTSAQNTRVQSVNGDIITFWPLEKIRGNTGDYSQVENKGWTFPIGEIFTEAKDLASLNGKCLVEAYPNEDFSVAHGIEPFLLTIENGRVLPSNNFPPGFAKLYNWIVQFEWEVMVRELGMGINPHITSVSPLSDINFHERKTWVHLSLGKKHGIYGKKLPKTEIQRFHIDVFIALDKVYIGDELIFDNGKIAI